MGMDWQIAKQDFLIAEYTNQTKKLLIKIHPFFSGRQVYFLNKIIFIIFNALGSYIQFNKIIPL